ncbi:recombinase RecT [Kitasatospora sp. NPDC056076]|uniref:recombinase RecT n=2 Tax=Streptomycetaceae TaxID=2062 RepID=UPI0035E0BFAC
MTLDDTRAAIAQQAARSTDLAARERSAAATFAVDDRAILSYLGLNANDARSHAVIAVCRRYNLDPLLKHVVLIPKGGVFITRDGYLHVAHESGRLDGIVVVDEPTLSDDGTEWKARVAVYRKDMTHPFQYPGRYPARGGNATYAQEMSLKNAEAHALRRAFNVSGLAAEDEMAIDNLVPAPASASWEPSTEDNVAYEGEIVEDGDQ